MRQVHYAIHRDDGSIISRYGDEVAWPVIDFANIGRGGNYKAPLQYNLEQTPVLEIGREWDSLVWTRFVPVEFKNLHRKFWGLAPLVIPPEPTTIPSLLKLHRVNFYFTRDYDIGDRAAGHNLVGVYHSQWGERTRSGLFHWFRYVAACGCFRFVEVSSLYDHEFENFKVIRKELSRATNRRSVTAH